ncbi:hypothetical protein BATDEDRAFT_91044 [Batrachochytrium dendrobatidis JAM81]|uniref:NADH dehydrogenase [ubiquinone] 1 beta subcomplex subunit 9 n=1 Tax=Batrachochytrium dendrobatidis (strain JAM81 / FGSC 10211) TaxID=684364 RepID=F4P8T1_BATDJ|nr:uncharacterized protein BATDEDRAFT_91044 [Batrachochytrium dendrobatidis JAM81]EGF78193.1 hypothetical protein BATDEDRAFT_91044 [Batrachochytrium dendrobatidis JAM81]KAJ8330737.1 hypothetical protein O5D80_001247 [Batrachochytrium dendrobatidis]KAK5664602.1 hypothetical protein QVD99_008661 [Batrachochytrium dendrobatidis]|eukprot:XP_006681231.1 hypothetical protein BATDEDRAFT_91044 [Batrachochytrium dendrobatidis JAM81]
MNSSIVSQTLTSAHTRYVKGLYRRSLRLAESWYWQRPEQRETCVKLRALFDNDKILTNPKEIELTLLNAERLLALNAHPTPYIAPSGFNGTSWERNLPIPEELIRRGVTPVDNS